LDLEYVRDRILVVFLDGKPVDDLDSAILKNGSVLTLSAAVPGLAGAAVRKMGEYARLRNSITYREVDGRITGGTGIIKLKLFNLLLREMGQVVLEKGIYVNAPDLAGLFAKQVQDFLRGCKKVIIDGEAVETGLLQKPGWLLRHGDDFLVRVVFGSVS
jgi:hypothetical protein